MTKTTAKAMRKIYLPLIEFLEEFWEDSKVKVLKNIEDIDEYNRLYNEPLIKMEKKYWDIEKNTTLNNKKFCFNSKGKQKAKKEKDLKDLKKLLENKIEKDHMWGIEYQKFVRLWLGIDGFVDYHYYETKEFLKKYWEVGKKCL